MNKTILITGGSGLIGKILTSMLLQKGYLIHHLSRNPELHANPKIKIFKWDVGKNEIDENCIDGVETIIHLAGEGIAEKRWTASRKEQIIKSRTDSIEMIYNLLSRKQGHQVKNIIASSAIGFYGDRRNETLTEESKAGSGFLTESCIVWEKAVDKGNSPDFRIVKLRTGVVLSAAGGALPEMAALIKKGFGSPLGSGEQWISWIHIHDAAKMYIFALENEKLTGTYNMVSPNPVTNKVFTETLASVFGKKIWLPNVPAIGLKLLMGEMSALVLDSAKVSSTKILAEGFHFDYPALNLSLAEIYSD